MVIGEVVHSGPRLARAVFSWGRDVQSGDGDQGGWWHGVGAGGCNDGPRQGKQRANRQMAWL